MNSMSGKVLGAINSSSTSLKRTLSSKTPPFRAIFDQSFAKLLQFQLNFAFNESSTAADEGGSDSTAEIPNEYRNLLLSLSDNRCDHILWIRSLRKLNWLGDGDFSFALDKCGVPTLKSGEYKLNLCSECLDMQMADGDGENDEIAFHWEGNLAANGNDAEYELQNHAELPIRSILPLIKKCAKMMRKYGQIMKGGVIVAFMPCILQLFVTIFAAARIGAVLVYVNAAINQDPNDLAQILILSGAQLILTVDGFYMDGKLQKSKQQLDLAIKFVEEKVQNALKVIVVRHFLNSNASQISDRSPSINSRKSLNENEFKMEMTPNRDFFWANLMIEMAADEIAPWEEENGDGVEWMDSEDIIFEAISKIKNGVDGAKWHFESYTVGQIALLVQLLATKFTKPMDGDEAAQIIAARQKELLKKRQSLGESKSFDERDEDSPEEEDDVALARKGSTRSQPGFIVTKKISNGSAKGGNLRKKSQQNCGPQIIWPMVEANDVLFLASLFAALKAKASIFLSETPPSRTDPLKMFRQLEDHKISQLLIAQSNLELLSKTMDSAKIWSGEEEEIVRFKLPSLRAIFSVVKGTLANRAELKAENEGILNNFIEKRDISADGQMMNIFHLFC